MIRSRTRSPHRQRGITLILGLLILALLSLLGIAAAADSATQERIAGNQGETLAAHHSAQSALAWAEDWLMSLDGAARPEPCAVDCSGEDVIRQLGVYPLAPENEPESWWLDVGHGDGHDPLTGALIADRFGSPGSPGLWLIEEVAYLDPATEGESGAPVSWYRVLSRSAPDLAGQAVVLEAVLARPWGEAAWTDPLPADEAEIRFCLSGATAEPCGRRAWRTRQ